MDYRKIPSYGLLILGFSFLIIALLLSFFLKTLSLEYAISIILTLGIGIISVGIAFYSIYLAYISDKRMRTVAEDTFLAIKGILEDKRLELMNQRMKLEHIRTVPNHDNILICQLAHIDYINALSFSIWKCLTYLRRLELFNYYMKKDEHLEDEQRGIINLLCHYYREIIAGRDILPMEISDEYKGHIEWMFWIVAELEEYPYAPFNNEVYELMLELQR